MGKATANLNRENLTIDDGNDSIVIVKGLGYIPGGRTLDVSGLSSDVKVIRAGHVIFKDTDGEYKPLGVTTGAYNALTSGQSYAGVLAHSVTVSDPRAPILTIGQINASASPYPITDTIKNGLPRIEFLY